MPKIKDRAYIINLDECELVGTRWRALYVTDENETYFGSFGVEHIPKDFGKFIGKKI